MTTNHTPGPWVIQRSRTIRPNYAWVCGQDWHELATVVVRSPGDKKDDATGLANARLIAAAPDLLAALEELCLAPNKHRPEEYWNAARAAIAKAKGE